MALKDWKKPIIYMGNIYYETKKRSKFYKGQPKDEFVIRHSLLPKHKKEWTLNHGNSESSADRFKTKAQALKFAKEYMKKY